MKIEAPLFAGVELGGTKCVVLLATGPNDILGHVQIPTSDTPDHTLRAIERALDQLQQEHGRAQSLGIASFGPLCLEAGSDKYGFITSTAKPGWRDTDVAARLGRSTGLPFRCETDVTGAALAEGLWGAAKGLKDFAYVTVGTGVGVGIIQNGAPLAGFIHPEFGHSLVRRVPGDTWAGSCPFHGDCVEGLASGSALQARYGRPASELALDSPLWDLAASALAAMLHNLILACGPRQILMGGGVMMAQPHLLDLVRKHLQSSLNGYVEDRAFACGFRDFITAPQLGALAGPLGAIAVAQRVTTLWS